jgi:hypothetical protein
VARRRTSGRPAEPAKLIGYRDETVFLFPPPIVQRTLIALLARQS